MIEGLLAELKSVLEGINRNIPVIGNRFEEYESFPIDRTLSEAQQLALVEEHRNKYNLFLEGYRKTQMISMVFHHLNGYFETFKQTHHIIDGQEVTEKQKSMLANEVVSQCRKIYKQYQRTYLSLGSNVLPEEAMQEYLEDHCTQLVEMLCAGKSLALDNPEHQKREELGNLLLEHRKKCLQQFLEQTHFMDISPQDSEAKEQCDQVWQLWSGMYFDQLNLGIGYCDEHAAIGVRRIFHSQYKSKNQLSTLEVVKVKYSENDGHVFIAIDRDPKSDLNNISSWGKDAILFDAWNKLVCKAEDFHKLPFAYITYPQTATWESTKFYSYHDTDIAELSGLIDHYKITGADNLETRSKLLLDEYKLLLIDENHFPATHKFIRRLIDEVKPKDLKQEIKLFITCSGNEPVTIIPGFGTPAIGVHAEFLCNIKDYGNSTEMLKFGLASAMVTINEWGVSLTRISDPKKLCGIDLKTLEITKDATTAIDFFRMAEKMEKTHQPDISLPAWDFRSYNKKSYDVRIKAVMVLTSKRPDLQQHQETYELPEQVGKEVVQIQPFTHYKEALKKCRTTIEKIKVLESYLDDLFSEILPYEVTHSPSSKVRDFCQHLSELKINLNNAEEYEAIDHLLQRAYELRIPAFEKLYFALFNKERRNAERFSLKPIGPFSLLQSTINDFVEATSYEEASRAALKFNSLYANQKDLFTVNGSGISYVRTFKKEHGRLPVGKERFFSAETGLHINWKAFVPTSYSSKPWQKFVEWAVEHNDKEIAYALFSIGLETELALWSIFSNEELEALIQRHLLPLTDVSGRRGNSIFYDSKSIKLQYQKYCESRHVLDTSALDTKGFSNGFCEFFDANLPVLLSISFPNALSLNQLSAAANHLLTCFHQIAMTGSEQDKATMKSFFLGREDKRDLSQLFNERSDYLLQHPYLQFVLQSNVLEAREVASFINLHYSKFRSMPTSSLLKILKLPYNKLTIPCIEEVFRIFEESKLSHFSNEILGRLIIEYCRTEHVFAMSQDALRLLTLAKKCRSTYFREHFLQFTWEFRDDLLDYDLDTDKMLELWKMYDKTNSFPSDKVSRQFALLLINHIEGTQSVTGKIECYQKWLFNKEHIDLPLFDLELRGKLVQNYVTVLYQKFGMDDGSGSYFNNIKPILDDIKEYAPKRDQAIIYSTLANKLETQNKVTEYIGTIVEPSKYFHTSKTDQSAVVVTLGEASNLLGKSKEGQRQFLDFISNRFTDASIDKYVSYLLASGQASEFCSTLTGYLRLEKCGFDETRLAVILFYNMFWDRPLEERAILINYLLVPSNKTLKETDIQESYASALLYVITKLFPNYQVAGSDDEFAVAFLRAYLDNCNVFLRDIFLAGIIIASNEVTEEHQSAGKKLALLCEHLGPAYIKLAQAIHSHPQTPEHIRRDLEHVKGRANPPYRWTLWRMINEVLPPEDLGKIKRVKKLLGSASYNLAIEVELTDGREVVLSLLRENAEQDAKEGFKHLKKTINDCQHPRMNTVKQSLIHILEDAESMSEIEMDHELCQRQYDIARDTYHHEFITVDGHTVQVRPSRMLKSGPGYRFIEKMNGIEFNDLSEATPQEKLIKSQVASAVVLLEFSNLLKGSYFDSDRHGNQLRVEIINSRLIRVGLYDFGEMSLEPPTEEELNALGRIIARLPFELLSKSVSEAFESLITDEIENAIKNERATSYLTRVRKSLLALQDFYKHIDQKTFIKLMYMALSDSQVHPVLKANLSTCLTTLTLMQYKDTVSGTFSNFNFFKRKLPEPVSYCPYKVTHSWIADDGLEFDFESSSKHCR